MSDGGVAPLPKAQVWGILGGRLVHDNVHAEHGSAAIR